MSDQQKCECCGEELAFRWTDTHGVGACFRCGLPYRIFHYEGDKRVEKPARVAIRIEWLPAAKAYWEETKSRVFPASYDIGFGERGGLSYSGASRDEAQKFGAWIEMHPELHPPNQAA